MNFSDIVALAKQGYKPGDIKELIDLTNSIPAEAELEAHADDDKEEREAPEVEEVEEEKPSQELDELKKQLADANNKIAELQKSNTKTDMSDTQDDSEILEDFVKSFM